MPARRDSRRNRDSADTHGESVSTVPGYGGPAGSQIPAPRPVLPASMPATIPVARGVSALLVVATEREASRIVPGPGRDAGERPAQEGASHGRQQSR